MSIPKALFSSGQRGQQILGHYKNLSFKKKGMDLYREKNTIVIE